MVESNNLEFAMRKLIDKFDESMHIPKKLEKVIGSIRIIIINITDSVQENESKQYVLMLNKGKLEQTNFIPEGIEKIEVFSKRDTFIGLVKGEKNPITEVLKSNLRIDCSKQDLDLMRQIL